MTGPGDAGDGRQHAFRDDLPWFEERAAGLLASARDGTAGALAALARWDAPLSPDGARAALARAHGFPSWAALSDRAGALADPDDPFVQAYHAIEGRNPEALAALLDAAPGLVDVRGTNDNDLLGLAGATGDPRLVALLLQRGADPRRTNVHGWTALHQAAHMARPDLAWMLIAAGARGDVPARGDGGTPLVVALFWGHPVPGDLVDALGLHPGNLRVAAGLGRLDDIRDLAGDGGPTADACAHRAFYRPHGGFPPWRPSDDPQEALDEALSWAARSGRAEAVAALVAAGADVDRDVYRGTPLAWAAAKGHTSTLQRLLDLGADPNGRTTFGGPDHGEGATALHLAAGDGHLDTAAALLEAGADPRATDGRYGATPADWADHGGQPETARLLR